MSTRHCPFSPVMLHTRSLEHVWYDHAIFRRNAPPGRKKSRRALRKKGVTQSVSDADSGKPVDSVPILQHADTPNLVQSTEEIHVNELREANEQATLPCSSDDAPDTVDNTPLAQEEDEDDDSIVDFGQLMSNTPITDVKSDTSALLTSGQTSSSTVAYMRSVLEYILPHFASFLSSQQVRSTIRLLIDILLDFLAKAASHPALVPSRHGVARTAGSGSDPTEFADNVLSALLQSIPEHHRMSLDDAKLLLYGTEMAKSMQLNLQKELDCPDFALSPLQSHGGRIMSLIDAIKMLKADAAEKIPLYHRGLLTIKDVDCEFKRGSMKVLHAFNTRVAVSGLKWNDSDHRLLAAASGVTVADTVDERMQADNGVSLEKETYITHNWNAMRSLHFHKGVLYVMNHMSVVEIPALMAAIGKVCVVMGKNVSKYPFFGELFHGVDFIAVPEDDPRRVHDIIRDKLQKGERVLIFPESMLHPGHIMSSFATLPFTHRAVYQPVSLNMSESLKLKMGEWKDVVMRLTSQPVACTVRLHFHDPIDNREGVHDVLALRDICQKHIADYLKLPVRNDIRREQIVELFDAARAYTDQQA